MPPDSPPKPSVVLLTTVEISTLFSTISLPPTDAAPRVDPVLANASHFHFPMRRPTGQLIWRYPRPGRRPLEPSSPPLQLGGGADKTAKDDDNRTIGPTPASISPQTLSTPLLEPKQSAPPCIRKPSREHQTRKRGGIKGTQGNKAAYWPRRDNDPWTATGSADHRGWTRAEAWRLGGKRLPSPNATIGSRAQGFARGPALFPTRLHQRLHRPRPGAGRRTLYCRP